MERMFWGLRRAGLLCIFIVALGLASSQPTQADTTLHTVLDRGKLIVGITYDSPPSGYIDAQGNVKGYCADIARYLAARLGVDLEFVQVTSATRVPLLRTGRIDVEIAITTPQKERNEVVDFTYSHIWDDGVLLVRAGSSLDPKDYQNPDKVIGATQGNGFVDNWKKVSPQANFKLYREETDVLLALQRSEVDAYLANSFSAHRFAAQTGGLAISKPWKSSPDALMVRQDDSKWRNWLNWALQRMWAENTIHKLYMKWYGIEPNFNMGDNGELEQRIEKIGKTDDPWQPLPPGFLDALFSDKSYDIKLK